MRYKQPLIWAFDQEISVSEPKNTRARVQRCLSQGSENLSQAHDSGIKSLIQRLDLTQLWAGGGKQGLQKGTEDSPPSPGAGESEFVGYLKEGHSQLLYLGPRSGVTSVTA